MVTSLPTSIKSSRRHRGFEKGCTAPTRHIIVRKQTRNKKAVRSQGEPRDAAVNFDTYRILQRHDRMIKILKQNLAVPLKSTALYSRVVRIIIVLRLALKVKVKVKADIALHGNPISELRDVTCRMGSQCYLPPDTSERAPPSPMQAGTRFTYPGGMEG